MKKQTVPSVFFGVLIFLCLTTPAHAYLDPGTGSYVFQLLAAGLLGGSFFLRSFIKKIINKVKRTDESKQADEDK